MQVKNCPFYKEIILSTPTIGSSNLFARLKPLRVIVGHR
jgi:hypothetical protein